MFFCKMLACGRFDAGICRLPHRQTGEFPGFWVDLFGKLCLTETVGLLRTPDRHLPEKIRSAALQRAVALEGLWNTEEPLTGIDEICLIEVPP